MIVAFYRIQIVILLLGSVSYVAGLLSITNEQKSISSTLSKVNSPKSPLDGTLFSKRQDTVRKSRMCIDDEKIMLNNEGRGITMNTPFLKISSKQQEQEQQVQKKKTSQKPSIYNKLRRRITVFWVAFRIFLEYKWASRTARRAKKKLGLSIDSEESDDHPEIIKLWSQVHSRNAVRLLQQIKDLAGFWVKIGQYLSTRADIMPPEYLQSLAELQDSMPPKSFKDILATIQEELDDNHLALIESIDPEPLSTASLAQVHRATLKKERR